MKVGEDDSSGDEAEPERDPGKRVKWDNKHVVQILPELVTKFGGTTKMKLKQFTRHPEHGKWFIQNAIGLKQIKEKMKTMKKENKSAGIKEKKSSIQKSKKSSNKSK